MKITKSQLKQIIKEEQQALIKENIISDMVDTIKDSGEDAWDWIKDNAEAVKDAAAAAGETVADFADDVAQAALRGVDTATGAIADVTTGQYGTSLSRRGKRKKRARDEKYAQTRAGNEAARLQTKADNEARRAEYAQREQDKIDAEERRIRNKENAAANYRYELDQQMANRRAREKEEESEYSRRQRALGKGGPGYFQSDHSPWRESIDRDKLARIVAEELQKVLKDR
jgi:hypothetical protein